MKRNILLVEPNYSNKYPPIGLMKIASYHRKLGDNVRYFKGNLQDFVLDNLFEECCNKLDKIDSKVNWKANKSVIKPFIKTKKNQLLVLEELGLEESEFKQLILQCLIDFADIFKKKKYFDDKSFDRIYVTTLFTFYWKITVETIEFFKNFVKNPEDLKIGGVLATLLHDELHEKVGIEPMKGLLDKPGILDPDLPEAAHIVVDDLPLDYSILDEIDYEYPTRSAFFTFMTKGCTRTCAFCSVPKLEPIYKPKIETFDKFEKIKSKFGDQQNLLLMDNNVLASPNFSEIIDEIKSMGFYKGATYSEPNQLDIAIENLKSGSNDYGFTRRSFRLINGLIPRLKENIAQEYYKILVDNDLLIPETITKENILKAYPLIAETFEKYRNKSPKLRYVDFNQGTDCRYVDEEKMKKMSEIPIRPLRIAFDYIGLKDQYTKAVKLAAQYGIKELSNYILYNFNDKPEDLYNRLKINLDLGKELNVTIFSFPMKYIPLFGEDAKHRQFTGKHWNKKYIRSIQSILNVTKGIVASYSKSDKMSFFEEAFGKDIKEFFEILYMPEPYIIYRHLCRFKLGYTQIWEEEFRKLEGDDLKTAKAIIETNIFTDKNFDFFNASAKVRHFLRHYTILSRDGIEGNDKEYQKIQVVYDDLIKNDQFIELTLTYDFETPIQEPLNFAQTI